MSNDENMFTVDGFDVNSSDIVEYVLANECENYVLELNQANTTEHSPKL